MKMDVAKLKDGKLIKLVIAGVVVVAVLVAACVLLTLNVRSQIVASNVASMEELALHDQNCISNSVELRWDNMEGAARQLSERDWQSEEEVIAALKEYIDNIPSVEKIGLLDAEGTEYLSTGLLRKDSYLNDEVANHNERFIARVNTTAHFRENSFELLIAGVPVNFTACGHQMKWLVCEFPITALEEELKIDSYDGQGFSSIIDTEGNYIVNISRSHNYLTYDNFFDDLEGAVFEGYSSIDEIRTTTTTTTGAISVVYKLDGVQNIMVITAMDFADWFFITTVPVSVFNAQAGAILRLFIALVVAIVVVVVAFALILFRRRQEREHLRITEAANKSKTEFLFNMSHDIRTPMNAILGYTDIGLRHNGDATRTKESFTKIKMAGSHLLDLINDILEMSRIEAGKLELIEEPCDMRRSIATVEQMTRSLAIAKSIDFSCDTSRIANPYVYADELHVNEIVLNLLSNAIKYTPEGGRVTYAACQLGEAKDGVVIYRFEVTDNGIGMSEEFQAHLFQAFSRENSSTVAGIEGAGLGLSIVKRIVDMIGGTIDVESALGEGSTFIVELPLRVMDEAAIEEYTRSAESTAVVPEGIDFAGKRVLLVEDNEMNREIACDILSDAGLMVDEVEDGELAVKAVAEHGVEYYDFILMDIQMPVMNGYEATRAIRVLQDGGRIPIIALSANAFAEDKEASLAAGMNDHVAKPIDVTELFAAMAEFL